MPRVKLFNEKEVLTKAMHLFWKQGYAATSVQDLVSHLGINRASLYDTFGDKEQLFFKAFELYRETSLDEVVSFLDNQDDIKQGLKLLFEYAIEEALTDKDRKGCFVVNTTTELIPNDDRLTDILNRNKSKFQDVFYQYLKRGRDNNQISKNVNIKSLAFLYYTLYNGLRVVSKVKPQRTELMDSVELALSLLNH